MSETPATLYFDFVDPLSYLLELELATAGLLDGVVHAPFELRPPPTPLVTVDDPAVAERWQRAHRLAAGAGIDLAPPGLVPWSRKAHELHLLAGLHGVDGVVRRATFDAYMVEGRDVGRVDVLVAIAVGCGLDATETKAVLDVDRHDADVAAARRQATALGLGTPPALVRDGEWLEGFHNRAALGTFLRGR